MVKALVKMGTSVGLEKVRDRLNAGLPPAGKAWQRGVIFGGEGGPSRFSPTRVGLRRLPAALQTTLAPFVNLLDALPAESCGAPDVGIRLAGRSRNLDCLPELLTR
jgi:hypothetical protein